MTDFGANEWLVDELYQKYLEDPNSVDEAWWNFFAAHRPDSRPASGTPASPGAPHTGSAAPTAPNGSAAAPPSPAKPVEPPKAPRRPPAPAAPKEPERRPAPPPGTAGAVESRVRRSAARPAPAAQREPERRPAPPPVPEGGEEVRLRGAAARTATNMEASLAVPTATSVRTIPAKLLIDNRIVINNHLKRGRGGKVSFTHLIGYAIIKALAAMPEMNTAFTEVDGKPVQIRPEHVNFGLAIDLQKSDGSRQLVVPNIKAADTLDFRQFWAAYEEIVR